MSLAIAHDQATQAGDLQRPTGKNFADDATLASAVYLSLFTHRQAHPDDPMPAGSTDRRGWWADGMAAHPWGSRLWLLSRKATDDQLNLAQDYVKEALQWLIDDGIASAVNCVCAYKTFPGCLDVQLLIQVSISKPQDPTPYKSTWSATLGAF